MKFPPFAKAVAAGVAPVAVAALQAAITAAMDGHVTARDMAYAAATAALSAIAVYYTPWRPTPTPPVTAPAAPESGAPVVADQPSGVPGGPVAGA